MKSTLLTVVDRETNLDDVLQIHNVFVNVSKGEVAKSGDLQKAFGKTDISDIVKEVRRLVYFRRPFTNLSSSRSSRKEKSKWERKKGTTTLFP